MLRMIWKVALYASAIAWFAAGGAIIANGPHRELVSNAETVFYVITVIMAVFVAADPWRRRFNVQLRGAAGMLLMIAGVVGMVFSMKHMLSTQRDGVQPSLLWGLLMIASVIAGFAGNELHEKYSCKRAPEPPF